MKKRLFSTLLAAAMVLALLPAAEAAGGYAPFRIQRRNAVIVFDAARVETRTVQMRSLVDVEGEYSAYVPEQYTVVTLRPDTRISIEGTPDEAYGSYRTMYVSYNGLCDGGDRFTYVICGALMSIEEGLVKDESTLGRADNCILIDNYLIVVDWQASPTAYASTQTVLVDGRPVEFQAYALKDAAGNDTNYVKLRDVASVLSGTAAQFDVGWDQAAGSITVTGGQPYRPNGTEMSTPYSGNRSYQISNSPLYINGQQVQLEAIVLTDGAGNGYTYFKLRDLGAALGFTVGWSQEQGIYIQTK